MEFSGTLLNSMDIKLCVITPILHHSAMCIFSKFKLSKHFFLLNSYFLLVNTFFSLLLNLSKCSTERKQNKIIRQTTKPTFLQKYFVYASIMLKIPQFPVFTVWKKSWLIFETVVTILLWITGMLKFKDVLIPRNPRGTERV